jgi:hypothetical protein
MLIFAVIKAPIDIDTSTQTFPGVHIFGILKDGYAISFKHILHTNLFNAI